MKRRLFLQGSLAAGALGALATTGLLMPSSAMAAWPKEAFQAKELSEALKQLLGSDTTTEDQKKVWIDADDAAEDGSQVRVEVYVSNTGPDDGGSDSDGGGGDESDGAGSEDTGPTNVMPGFELSLSVLAMAVLALLFITRARHQQKRRKR